MERKIIGRIEEKINNGEVGRVLVLQGKNVEVFMNKDIVSRVCKKQRGEGGIQWSTVGKKNFCCVQQRTTLLPRKEARLHQETKKYMAREDFLLLVLMDGELSGNEMVEKGSTAYCSPPSQRAIELTDEQQTFGEVVEEVGVFIKKKEGWTKKKKLSFYGKIQKGKKWWKILRGVVGGREKLRRGLKRETEVQAGSPWGYVVLGWYKKKKNHNNGGGNRIDKQHVQTILPLIYEGRRSVRRRITHPQKIYPTERIHMGKGM